MSTSEKTGLWLIGGRGSVATTTIAGAAALRAGLVQPTGLVTELPPFAAVGLPAISDIVVGGHDLAETRLSDRAQALAHAGVIPSWLPQAVADVFAETEENLRPGISPDELGGPPLELVHGLQGDLEAFRERNDLTRVVVVNVSSTEAFAAPDPAHESLPALEDALARGQPVLSATGLYAYASLDAGCSYVDFTPSLGTHVPALFELARARGVPYAGNDGKTGETLLKTALAPVFVSRALKVRSWTASNILGGGDGAALADPSRARAKLDSKRRSLEGILGDDVELPVSIQYVADMGEWKTAWDHISFEGFLGTRMRMQFIWEGCDSALAAPLVLDLARLAARAHEAGLSGPLAELAFFFKSPVGSAEHRLEQQFALLCGWATNLPVEAPA
ncbi:MAG TPA: inositol-3-phosphate synthase [Gaiellaceae bacterium]|nr:inositol-3-phosphate synthase [Gaiellaceae bacterium]